MIWQEPAKGGYPDRSFLALPGEERMGAARRGLIPYSPMGYLTELEMTEGSRGHSTFSMPASPWFANSSGLISGGVLALIGDAALGLGRPLRRRPGPGDDHGGALDVVPAARSCPRPGTAITGSGQLIHRGRSLGISEAFLFDDDDQLISHGTTRCTVFPPVDPLPDPPGEHPRDRSGAVPGATRTIRCGGRSRARSCRRRSSSDAAASTCCAP